MPPAIIGKDKDKLRDGILLYFCPDLGVAEAVKVEVGGSEDDLQRVAHHLELSEGRHLGVDAAADHDSAHSHGQVGQQEDEVEHEQEVDQILVPSSASKSSIRSKSEGS